MTPLLELRIESEDKAGDVNTFQNFENPTPRGLAYVLWTFRDFELQVDACLVRIFTFSLINGWFSSRVVDPAKSSCRLSSSSSWEVSVTALPVVKTIPVADRVKFGS